MSLLPWPLLGLLWPRVDGQLQALWQVSTPSCRSGPSPNSKLLLIGTMASGIHASIGNAVAGSTFATIQSAAMGGAGAAKVAAVVQGVGGALGAGGVAGLVQSKP